MNALVVTVLTVLTVLTVHELMNISNGFTVSQCFTSNFICTSHRYIGFIRSYCWITTEPPKELRRKFKRLGFLGVNTRRVYDATIGQESFCNAPFCNLWRILFLPSGILSYTPHNSLIHRAEKSLALPPCLAEKIEMSKDFGELSSVPFGGA